MNATIRPFALPVATFVAFTSAALGQGPLTPPGGPAPSFKTLQQIEPRTPISSLPFTISDAGSYYLTTNLTATPGLVVGITIAANDVTIDLNGFALAGEFNTRIGISSSGSITNIAIRNGTVRNWRGGGVILANTHGGILEKLRVVNNGSGTFDDGISVGTGFRVIDSTANGNTGSGIVLFDDCNVSGCTADSNGVAGITGIGFGNMVRGCTARNNGVGIYGGGSDTVSDCTVFSNVRDGIAADNYSTVTGCTATGNGRSGIAVGAYCSVRGCTATSNTGDGISATAGGSTVTDCTASANGGMGIDVGAGSTVRGCTATSNTGDGISATAGSTVTDCTASANGGMGIDVGAGSTVMGCTARGNDGDGISAFAGSTIRDCTATENTGDGIQVSDGCRVEDNTCFNNGYLAGDGAGIRVTGQKNRIDSNQATDNDRGIHATAIRNFIVRNSARANGSNYVIVAGNRIAQIVQPAVNAADIPHANTGNTNGFTGVDPWANFSH